MAEPREDHDALRANLQVLSDSVLAPQGLAHRLIDGTSTPTGARPGPSAGPPIRHRWVGRWMVPLASAAVVFAVVFAGSLIHAHLRSTSTGGWQPGTVVPWKYAPLPVGPDGLKNSPTRAASAGTRLCTSTDFALVSAGSELNAYGPLWVRTDYVLRSTATSGCAASVYGLPVALVDAAGTSLPNDNGRIGGPYLGPDPLVTPGQLVSGSVGWNWYGGSIPRPVTVLILPTGGGSGTKPTSGLQVRLGTVPVPQHPGENVSSWHAIWETGVRPSVSDPGSLGSLAVVLHAPVSVRVGRVLTYSVELQNRTDTSVRLDPCPDLNAVLQTSRVKSYYDATYQGSMNCPQAPRAIAPHSSVTFAMELNTTGTIATTGQLNWTMVLNGYRITGAGASIIVTP